MPPQEMLLKHKMSLLQLAEQLHNIRLACKMMGVSRQHYYDIKARFKQAGVDGLKGRQVPRFLRGFRVGAKRYFSYQDGDLQLS